MAAAVKTLVPLEVYLNTSYEWDPEYVDGEVVERALPDISHSIVAHQFSMLFGRAARKNLPCPQLRIAVSPTRYRVPDLAVFAGRPVGRYPATPPLVVVEILSAGDAMREVISKLREYLAHGVTHVWLVDPGTRGMWIMDKAGLREVTRFSAPELELEAGPQEIFGELLEGPEAATEVP